MSRRIDIPSILLFFFVLALSCEDIERPSDIPFIEAREFSFVEGPDNTVDTLKLTFDYTDGDSDLGLSAADLAHVQFPYHYVSFFQGKDGALTEVIPEMLGQHQWTLNDLDISNGILLFPRSRKDPVYSKLLPPYSCANYQFMEFLIPTGNRSALDEDSQIRDTITIEGNSYYLVKDTLYIKRNPNHFNLEVDFLVAQPDGSFVEFDWMEVVCLTFDARFPVLYDDQRYFTVRNGPFRAETFLRTRGRITYLMQSHGFKILFGGKTFKLRFSIKDRALNVSNVAETELLRL
jgi:hypothetical protein